MTGYHIRIGYLSHGPSVEDAWGTLKESFAELCRHPGEIAAEAIKFGMHPVTAREYAEPYRSREDATIKIIEPKDGEPGEIMQLASGSGTSRLYKEEMRRAFCRLVLAAMHRVEIEISITVA